MYEQTDRAETADMPVEAERQLPQAVIQLSERLTDLEKTAEALAVRLEPIIAHHPNATADMRQDKPQGSPLGDELERQVDRVEAVTARLRYIRDSAQV